MIPTPPHDLISVRLLFGLIEGLVSVALSAAVPVSLVVFALITF